MNANGLVMMPGKGPAWKMAPGRSSTLKLQNGETDESVMMFEEVAPVGTVTPMHLHHDSDEVAYVLSGEITFKYTPGGAGKLFEEMLERPVDPMNEHEFGAVAERHGWKIVGPPPF